MALDRSTFEYLKPTEPQMAQMASCRANFRSLTAYLDDNLPEGADKTYLLRKLRECAMWANICLTRNSDGSPRT